MGIQINGQTDRISAVDGSFSIQDLAEVNVTGVATASNFKTGTSNVHSTGYECANINATGIVTAASANFTGNVSVGGTLTYQDVTNIDSVGVITARAGIVVSAGHINLPTGYSLNWSDTHERIEQSDGKLEFFTNNTEKVTISGGNLGIGTDNPDATLKVNVASGNNGVVVQNTSTANIALLGARNGDATVQIGQWGSTASGSTFGLSNANLSFIYTTSYGTTHPSALALGTVSNKPIVFATNNTEKLRIDDVGRLTITGQGLKLNPNNSSLYALDGSLSYYATNNGVYLNGAGTNGWLRLNASGPENNQNAINIFGSSNATSNKITMRTGNNDRFVITNDGVTQQYDLSGNYHVIASSRDGSTSARAATSAWEIKKTLGPDAKTGYYYLTNPYDSTTQQWWCDMETDGGGWILVAFTGDGQMGSNLGNWYDRNNKGGFNGLAQGFYRGGGYWNTWGDLKGQLMWECRTLDTYFNSTSCSKVGINWGKNNNLPSNGTRAYSNITGNANTLFENWCWDIYNAPGFEPSNYSSAARNNRIGGANYFTEHMVITWSFRSTGGSADDGSNGPYWMIGAHHDGLHQHYEESLSGSDGANGDGGYQVASNEDTGWGGGGQQYSMNRLARHSQNGGSVFVWMR